MKRNIPFVLMLALSSIAWECQRRSGPGDDDPLAQQNQDIEHYEEVIAELENTRVEFLGEEATELYSYGNRLFWLRMDTWSPTLHSWDATTDTRVNCSFSIGSGDRYNYRASLDSVATAEEAGMGVVYHVYDIGAPGTEITTVEFDAPSDEQRWWAYDVDGTTLYVVVTGEETGLYRVPAGGTPEMMTTFESAGCAVAEFWDFAVEGNTMIFIESGRIWRFDLPSNTATWLGNETQISGAVNFGSDGVMYEVYTGYGHRTYLYRYDTRETVDLSEAIAASGYQLNETFASTHLYYEGYTRHRDWMVYIGSGGVHGYHLYRGDVEPLLLSPRGDVRIDYRYPVVLDNGMLFVTGLTSTSGATGADGPVYRVDVSSILD